MSDSSDAEDADGLPDFCWQQGLIQNVIPSDLRALLAGASRGCLCKGECHCKVWDARRVSPKLAVLKSGRKGFGLFCAEDIKAGRGYPHDPHVKAYPRACIPRLGL